MLRFYIKIGEFYKKKKGFVDIPQSPFSNAFQLLFLNYYFLTSILSISVVNSLTVFLNPV